MSGPFRPAADVTSLYLDKEPWLVPGIIPLNGVVILASAPKTGKTCFATAIARAVAKGEPFLGEPVIQTPVLWCAYEEVPQERLLLHEGLTCDDPLLIAYPGSMPPLPSKMPKVDRYGRRNLENEDPPFPFNHALEVGARLIVIDCLHAAVEGAPLEQNSVARAVMGPLRVWSAHFGIAILVLHHLTKSSTRGWHPERFADSAQILAASSCHFFMDRDELDDQCSTGRTPRSRKRAQEPPSVQVDDSGKCTHEQQVVHLDDSKNCAQGRPHVQLDDARPNHHLLEPVPAQDPHSVRGDDRIGKARLEPADSRKSSQAPKSKITLHGRGRNPAPPNRIEIESEGILEYRLASKSKDWVAPKRLSTPERVATLLQEGWELTAGELARRLALNPSSIRVALSELCRSGKVRGEKKARENLRYAYVANDVAMLGP